MKLQVDTNISRTPAFRIVLAEALGMFILVYCGNATIAQVILGHEGLLRFSPKSKPFTYGDVTTIALGYGIGLALGYVACAKVSEGHLNPAVSLIMVLSGRIRPLLLPAYWAGQALGATLGAAFVVSIHGAKLLTIANAKAEMAFATFPMLPEYNMVSLLFDQTWTSAVFMMVYLAVHDKRGDKIKNLSDPAFVPIILGATYAVLILTSGINAGSAINPARDFFPRVVAMLNGYEDAFAPFFWIPWLVPFAGCLLGALLYSVSIGWFWPNAEEDQQTKEEELVLDLEDSIDDLAALILPKSKKDAESEESEEEEENISLDLAMLAKTPSNKRDFSF